jgi:hypothetical protein
LEQAAVERPEARRLRRASLPGGPETEGGKSERHWWLLKGEMNGSAAAIGPGRNEGVRGHEVGFEGNADDRNTLRTSRSDRVHQFDPDWHDSDGVFKKEICFNYLHVCACRYEVPFGRLLQLFRLPIPVSLVS